MESPLSFDSTENFRKKLLVRNLKPYKVENGFTSNDIVAPNQYQIVDYSVIDSPSVEVIGEIQESSLYPLNKYGPQDKTSYGNTVNINLNLNTQTNFGEYDYSDSFGSKLELNGNIQESLLYIKNLYGPTQFGTSYGDTVNINKLYQVNTNLGLYGYPNSINSKLEQIGNQKEIDLIVKNVYKPQTNDFGSTKWSINDDLNIVTNGNGEYTITDTIGSRLELLGNQYEILNKIKNVYKNPGDDFGSTVYWINNDLVINTIGEGLYSITDTQNNLLEQFGTQQEINLRIKNKYTPDNNNDYGPTRWNINNDRVMGSNEGEYNFSDTIGSQLEKDGLIEQHDAYVVNRYVPGDGSYKVLTIDDVQIQTTSQRYYNSAQSFVFVPSEYSPLSILTSSDPSGSNGSLSQDSALANIGAKQLQKEFKFRVASELLSETIGRVNNLESSIDPDSGEISVKPKSDPFNAAGIISGNVPLLIRNYKVTSPDTAIGKAIGFAGKLAGLYSPYSIIPDEYFDYPEKRLLNQLIENPVALLTNTVMGAIRSITSKNIRRGSDLFLAYTSPATRDLLWGQLFYNEFRPDYRLNSLRNPNLFSPKPNFYVGTRKNSITDIISPVTDLPEYKNGKTLDSAVYGYSDVAKEYEGDTISKIFFGLNTRNFYDGNVAITSNFSWSTQKSFFIPGRKAGRQGRQEFDSSSVFSSEIKKQFTDSESTNYDFKEGSLLDITQKIVDAGSRDGVRKLEHVGNAINQVAKVFNDGYMEITKGSRVIKYVTKNSIDTSGKEFEGLEYCRLFTKDTPFYTYGQLQKTDGNIRKFGYSVLDNTYNLNIAPMNDKNGQSTNIVDGRVKKYMFSLENLAWRTSNKPGFTVDDLPACEKGPNGGRIMWFPPYDLTFSDESKPDFETVNFIGRPEPIYTYKNTSRSGSISWTILVDHPSISNLLIDQELKSVTPESEVTKIMDSFFAGCLKYDLYDLSKKFVQFSPNDIQDAINFVKTKEDVQKVLKQTPPSQTTSEDTTQSTIDELNDKNKEYFMFFENDLPKKDTDNDFAYWFNEYKNNKTNYQSNGKDKIFAYTKTNLNPGLKPITPQTLPNTEPDFSLKEYIDTRDGSLTDFFENSVEKSLTVLDDFISKIGKVLDSGGKVTFSLLGSASSTNNPASNSSLSKRRIESVKKYILAKTFNGKKLEDYYKKTLTIKEEPKGDTSTNLKDEKLKEIDCSLKFERPDEEGTYSIQAMACRRVKISDVQVSQVEKPKEEQPEKPEGEIPNILAADVDNTETNTPQSNNFSETTIKDTPLYAGMTKKLIRNLLSECNYFQMLQENSPVIYDGIKKRFKHFQPAFHSITPEGLNARLTFLQQCVRPGDTIPTVKQTGSGSLTLDYQDAFNSVFGSPPVLVLRIGDFYHTKIVPDSLSIKFDKDGLYDLNPEGIGVQPMIASITLSFKFIGGSGLAGPISKLQNALSFNYYANTEMYDERADVTEPLNEKYDSEFFEAAKLNTPTNPQIKPTNEIGNTIGDIKTSQELSDGTQTGTISYESKMKDFIQLTKTYTSKVYDTLKQTNEKHLLGGLYVINTDRKYQNGKYYTNDVKIYGKSNNYQDKIDLLFSKIKDDIDSGQIPVLGGLNSQNFTNQQKTKVKKQLKKMVDEKKTLYLSDIDNNNNSITQEELNLVSITDKLNFVTNATDGFINKKGNPIIYNTSGTTQVDVSDTSYPNTLIELQGDYLKIADDMNQFITKLEEYQIITTSESTTWKNNFSFDLLIGDSVYEKRFNMVFGIDVITDIGKFIDTIVSTLNTEDKQPWKSFIASNLGYDLNTNTQTSDQQIYSQFKKQKDEVDKRFKKFFDEYYNNKFTNYNPYNKDKKRILDFATQVPITPTSEQNLKNLNSSVNSTDDKFNLKKTFK
jgi:hypothetical protein